MTARAGPDGIPDEVPDKSGRTDRPARSSFARVALIIVLGFAVAHLGSAAWWGHERMLAGINSYVISLADRALVLATLDREQPELAARIAQPLFDARFAAAAMTADGELAWPHNDEVLSALRAHLRERGFAAADTATLLISSTRRAAHVEIAMPLDQQRWLLIRGEPGPGMLLSSWFGAIAPTSVMMLVLFAVLIATRRATRWFGQFADAADRLGLGDAAALPVDRGPVEVRRASASFNRMQRRIRDYLDERTTLLGAVSHDLRTLATRLKLRIDSLASDSTASDGMRRDVDDMVQILDETLAFVREDACDEPMTAVDLGSLIQVLVLDRADVGVRATVSSTTPGITVLAQPLALRRAFGNLIDNAIRYGGAANVTVRAPAVVEVHDPGPGMSEAAQQRALLPFVRGDQSRNRDSGGTGLGLAIARTVIERHRGALTFKREADGFTVQVALPVG